MSLLPSPLAAALAGTGLACFACRATRRPDPGLKMTGLAVLAFALTPVPAHADQFVEAADNATIDCELARSEEHTSELQSLMRISYAVFCLKKKKYKTYPK